ncbi:hypothetical protein D3C86_1591410 [compost metagenome]
MPVLGGQQLAYRAARGHGIARGPHCTEVIAAIGMGVEQAAQVAVGLFRVLVVIEANRRRLPDLHDRTRYRRAIGTANRATDEQRQSRCVILHHAVAARVMRRMGAIERPQQCAGRAPFARAVVHGGDQRGQAKHIGRKHNFVIRGVCGVPKRGDKLEPHLELLVGRPDFAQEVVQVLDQRCHHRAQAGVFRLRHRPPDHFRD